MSLTKWTGVVAVGLLLAALTACGAKQQDAAVEKKLEEMQKQLDDTKKQLEDAKATEQAAKDARASTANAPANAASATKSGASSMPKNSQVATNTSNIAANKSAIEKNASGIANNKDAIATNKAAISTNSANIEKNRQGVDEAKKMAAPAPYHTLAAGTPVVVRTTSKISTKTSATGSLFEATLEEPLEVGGYLVAGKGATVEGVVSNADPGGKVKGVATISLALRSVIMEDGRRLPLKTASVTQEAKKSGKKDALKVGIASGVGAAIGAIAGGGKGAAIGAGVGAGGGTGMVLATHGDPAEVASESVLNFALSAPVKLQELKK